MRDPVLFRSMTRSHSFLSRLFYVFQLIGESFLAVSQFSSVVRLFVLNGPDSSVDDCEKGDEALDIKFVSEAKSLLYLHGSLVKNYKEKFLEFSDFSLNCGMPVGSVLMSSREVCRRCGCALFVDEKPHVVVVYHAHLGTYLGSRVTKMCRKCKIYEHYGYWTENKERFYDKSFLELEFFLSSEETAFQVALLKQCASLLIVGAVPFSTFSEAYNRQFDYNNECGMEGEKCQFKRRKRFV